MGSGIDPRQTPARRDRLWLLNALAIALLTLLGAWLAKRSAATDISKSPPSIAPTHCSARLRCSTNSFPPCRSSCLAAAGRAVRHNARRTSGLCRYFRGRSKYEGSFRERRAEISEHNTSTWCSPCRPSWRPLPCKNKAVVYGILFRTVAETLRTIAADLEVSCGDRLLLLLSTRGVQFVPSAYLLAGDKRIYA